MGTRILIAEDDARAAALVTRGLAERLGAETRTVIGGREAVRVARQWKPHLVVLDIGLADGHDGYAVCRELREFSEAGIVMLTGKGRESEKLLGFDCGADDYLTKPFSVAELAARCAAVLRRAAPAPPAGPAAVEGGDVRVDLAARMVTRGGAPVALSKTELKLLLALARHAGKVCAVEDLLVDVWGPEYRDQRGYVEVYVSKLRAKLEADRANPQVVVTVPPLGYMFKGE
jgi:two-component system KDP operon response regulator KdpE